MPTYFAINMNDFHTNQDESITTVRMMIVDAKTKIDAAWHMGQFYPGIPWAIVTKSSVDANTICGKRLHDGNLGQVEFITRKP